MSNSARAAHVLPRARGSFQERLLCCGSVRPHKSQPALTSVLIPRAVYCLYLRLIYQPSQASSHHALPTAVSETSTRPVPVGTCRPWCPVLVSDLSSLQAPGLSGSEPTAAPPVLRDKGTAQPPQRALRSAAGLTNLPRTRNPRRWPKRGSSPPSPSPGLLRGAAAVCGRTALPDCSGDPVSLLTPCGDSAGVGPLSPQAHSAPGAPWCSEPSCRLRTGPRRGAGQDGARKC